MFFSLTHFTFRPVSSPINEIIVSHKWFCVHLVKSYQIASYSKMKKISSINVQFSLNQLVHLKRPEMVQCVIKYDNNPNGVFYCGQTMSGVVELLNDKPRKIKALSLRIVGFAIVRKANLSIYQK